ncbi:MAG: nucleotidyltransferase domain-containing protein [Acidobacteria bacterium]|nr:MAG: nucleotidyltransferase domain-containing protein [Acidobacteriota bacterium]REK11073.1 MAG: nucleotidyltransferase domain-containing protein [Acidobacteriota bacterium]
MTGLWGFSQEGLARANDSLLRYALRMPAPQPQPRRETAELVRRLRDYFASDAAVEVAAAYLFGSQAEGRSHRESDVDVAVLLPWSEASDSEQAFEHRLRLITDLSQALGTDAVDVVVLNQASPLFGRAVVQRGVRIFVGDAEAAHAYRRDVQLLAADLEPFVQRHRRRLLQRLREPASP